MGTRRFVELVGIVVFKILFRDNRVAVAVGAEITNKSARPRAATMRTLLLGQILFVKFRRLFLTDRAGAATERTQASRPADRASPAAARAGDFVELIRVVRFGFIG